ncbi:hypothetical protein D3C75_549370 [compost metagenome]
MITVVQLLHPENIRYGKGRRGRENAVIRIQNKNTSVLRRLDVLNHLRKPFLVKLDHNGSLGLLRIGKWDGTHIRQRTRTPARVGLTPDGDVSAAVHLLVHIDPFVIVDVRIGENRVHIMTSRCGRRGNHPIQAPQIHIKIVDITVGDIHPLKILDDLGHLILLVIPVGFLRRGQQLNIGVEGNIKAQALGILQDVIHIQLNLLEHGQIRPVGFLLNGPHRNKINDPRENNRDKQNQDVR